MAETTPDRARLRALCEGVLADAMLPDCSCDQCETARGTLAALDQLDQQAETIQRLREDMRYIFETSGDPVIEEVAGKALRPSR